MSIKNYYKPRHKLSFISKNKIRPYKDSYLRRFYARRSKHFKRLGLFIRCILVAKNIKWKLARKSFRPVIKISGLKNINRKNTTGFGRVKRFKGKYRMRFYLKQQARFFYGKLKEGAFRSRYLNHKLKNNTRTNSFFSIFESRLDRVFFRIRLMPTIFSCNQYIHYNGLEVNGILEYSPHKMLIVGDRVSIPDIVWRGFFNKLLQAIQSRRWGLYIFRSRIFKKLKKTIYYIHKQLTRHIYKKIFKKKISKLKKVPFHINVTKPIIRRRMIHYLSKYKFACPSFMSSRMLNKKVKVSDFLFFSNRIFARKNPYKRMAFIKLIKIVKLIVIKITKKVKERKNRIKGITKPHKNKAKIFRIERNGFAIKKKNFISIAHYKAVPKFKRKFKRKRKIKKKRVRIKKYIRIKGIHFFIPKYFQINFRTLSIMKRGSASQKDIYYPFRRSLAAVYSFYISKGF